MSTDMVIAYKCSRCKHTFNYPMSEVTWACDSCDMVHTRPVEKEIDRNQFDRAKDLWAKRAFGDAETAYNLLLTKYPHNCEAIWGRLMCYYGVEYVRDTDNKMKPTVHFTRDENIFEQADYALACEKARDVNPLLAGQYEADAKYIHQALEEIKQRTDLRRSYDVFLCHKTTPLKPKTEQDAGGEMAYREAAGTGEKLYTEDFHRAYRLYHWLEQKGYRVFFAPVACDKEIGANYEAAIYHALKTAKTMILVCSSKEHLNAVWVRSEWSRFMSMMEREGNKRLIPVLYNGMREYDLPMEFQHKKLQTIESGSELFHKNILDAIEAATGKNARSTEAADRSFITAPAPEGVVITGYVGCDAIVNIPEKLDGMRVVGIRKMAFKNCLTIKHLRIPDGVKEIEEGTFYGCSTLRDISLPVNLKKIGRSAFFGCSALEKVELPSGLEEIGDFAFEECRSMEFIEIPASVHTIGKNPLMTCTGLQEIRVSKNNGCYSVTDDMLIRTGAKESMLICFPAGHEVKNGWLQIPDVITNIGYGAVAACGHIKSVVLPHSVEVVGQYAFADCSNLSTVVFDGTTQSIGDFAFEGCEKLRSVTLPGGLQEIGRDVFKGCMYQPRRDELPRKKAKR